MYIDGVFSGGGIRGIALIGAIEEIEKRGYQFARVAGSSAGAIIAAFLAAGYKSKEIFELVDEMDLKNLLDERKSFLPFSLTKWVGLYWTLGLYKGDALEVWLENVLAKKGLQTFSDLPQQKLRFIASDITNGRLLVIPDDLEKYGLDPKHFPIARAIRMSCSIPYFFEPVRLKVDRETSIIVDGGVLSNFPIWLFEDEHNQRERPIIGIKLSPKMDDVPKNKIENAIQLFKALFETMKDAHDARHISSKQEKDIIFIPSDGVFATEFDLNDEMKQRLVQQGRECAIRFFNNWRYDRKFKVI
ncbi:patatin-like phospholipase family protein [Bacillus tuaregi]|uniref:patatin-like phospholipase family protein n=1 Tax=Bacillus tuaregi TaxID=1816695 RepID=UPI0008F97682|nr:patatin-like phospholipase family protein [Bacillus tuaregi]